MSLLALLAAQASIDPPEPEADLPVPRPTSAPYNAPEPCVIPTPEGTGSTVHPSAIDMGTRWNGYRYWMANTPYPGEDPDTENPCVWGSNDAQTWEVPPGGSNPIYPTPESGHWADTDLLYDPDGDRLVMVFNNGGGKVYVVTSDDGITWPADHGTPVLTSADAGHLLLSPSLVRVDQFLWRMYFSVNGLAYFEAPSPDGPWGNFTQCTGATGWHSHVILDPEAGEYRAITTGLTTYRSSNGIVWSMSTPAVLSAQGWEDPGSLYYRACIRPYGEDEYHLWYSKRSTATGNYHTAYTRVPKSFWT